MSRDIGKYRRKERGKKQATKHCFENTGARLADFPMNHKARAFLALAICVVPAFLWFLMFDPRCKAWVPNFWAVMSTAAASLILISFLMSKREDRSIYLFNWRHIPMGLLLALFLYGVTWGSGKTLAYFFPQKAPQQVESVYELKFGTSQFIIAGLLLFLIGPAEEIFWRGYLQTTLVKGFGASIGFLLTTAIYTLIHIWSHNPTLLAAAAVLGAIWGLCFQRWGRLWPVLISHALWDCVVFVVAPVHP
ncbi:putative CPBP family intramembrane metalloprotease [Paratrimastix pyriformis]|uniref:CPBP family intramembrane metalloprotease n=1 Tax=Paratrimastix pyriformis TaxID=342808 RepID=A0ABQ8UWB1_9EUKA|nr:putative CPBP family intramembrane metalloprotease [Paratrimastix pyriformis]